MALCVRVRMRPSESYHAKFLTKVCTIPLLVKTTMNLIFLHFLPKLTSNFNFTQDTVFLLKGSLGIPEGKEKRREVLIFMEKSAGSALILEVL